MPADGSARGCHFEGRKQEADGMLEQGVEKRSVDDRSGVTMACDSNCKVTV